MHITYFCGWLGRKVVGLRMAATMAVAPWLCLWAACWEAREGKVGAGEGDLGPGVLVVALKLSDGALRWLESSPVGSCHGCVWEEREEMWRVWEG